MAAISKNIYFVVLYDIINKYNNTVNRNIKMKPIEIMGNYYAEYNGIAFNEISNKKNHKFKVGDNVRI